MISKHPDSWIRCHEPSPEERLAQYVHRLAENGYDPRDHAYRAQQGLSFIKELTERKSCLKH